MIREWYVKFDQEEKGPYAIAELRTLSGFSPDTLVWKKGFSKWIQARKVRELKELFDDPDEAKARDRETKQLQEKYGSLYQANDVLTLNPSFQPFPLWAIILIIALLLLFLLQ